MVRIIGIAEAIATISIIWYVIGWFGRMVRPVGKRRRH